MSGIANWQAQIRIDIEDLKKRIKVAEGEINNFTNEDRKVKLDIDTETLERAIQKLDKMLDSLGKGTGDFKQFENLSKELSSIVSEVQSLSKAFGKVDDSGAKTLLSSIQNIDKSFSELSQNILNVNKNMSDMGGNTSGAVKQVKNISDAYQDTAKEAEKLADAQSKIGQKTNNSSASNQKKDAFQGADTKIDKAATLAKDLNKTLNQVDIPTDSFDKVLQKLDRTKSELVDVVKITRKSVSDKDGKFHDSYTLKDSRGSTEIYGVNSKTNKGQILEQNIVKYDAKKDSVNKSKEELEIQKKITKEIEEQEKANQKKFQKFQKENDDFEKEQKETEAIKRQKDAYENLMTTIKEYGDVAKRVSSGKADDGDLERMTQLESKISELQKQPILSESQIAKSESALVKLYDQLDKIERKTQKSNQKKVNSGFDNLSTYSDKVTKYKTTIDRLKDGGWASDAYEKNVNTIEKAVGKYETLLNELKNKDASLITNEDIQTLKEYEDKIKKTISAVQNMSAAEKGYDAVSGQKELDKIHKLLNENSKMSSKAKAQIKAFYKEIESGNPSMSLNKIHAEIMKIVNAEVEAGRGGKSFFNTLKNSGFHQIAAQMAGMVGVYDVINVIKQAASTVTELNTQITELAKVSEQSSKQIYADFDSYANIAKEVRGTISDTIAATADWSKNGYSIPDAKQLAEVSQLYKNVGDGIDIDTANESLISTLKGFKLEADEAEHIVDVFNEVSNNEAISSAGIGESLQRSAASFNAANTSLEQSVALVTATNSVLQDPEKVGNMWKTVSARIRGADTELKDMGEDTDGMITSTSKLQALVKGMTGVDILESDGKTFKDIYTIVSGIADKWSSLKDIDRAALLEKLAGLTYEFARIYRNINCRIYLIARVA